jgi:hypothetical protein
VLAGRGGVYSVPRINQRGTAQPDPARAAQSSPEQYRAAGPCSSAATMYMAMTGSTAPFIVILTEMSPRGMSSNSYSMGNGRVSVPVAVVVVIVVEQE